jgi:hypothetical protein
LGEAGGDVDFLCGVDEVGDVAAVEVGALGFYDDGFGGGEAGEDVVAGGAARVSGDS